MMETFNCPNCKELLGISQQDNKDLLAEKEITVKCIYCDSRWNVSFG